MSAPSTCICTLNVRSFTGSNVVDETAELVAELRKAFISGDNLIVDKRQRAKAVSGICTLTLVQSASEDAKVNFYLNFNDGTDYRTIVFDPITIPASASVDLSTLLTVTRG